MTDWWEDDISRWAYAPRGRTIYMVALAGRRGFRSDQLNIEPTDGVWLEIFTALGIAAERTEARHER